GGQNSVGAWLSTVYAYTPGSNTWIQVASMPTARDGLAAAAGADGRIYALRGSDASLRFTNTAYAYTPGSSTWTQVASMPTGGGGRYGLAAVAGTDGRIYAVGGSDASGGIYNTVYAYTPSSNTWAQVASMPTGGRVGLAAAAGADGRIYAL